MNADEKITAIEEIAAAIAHEVKNPLTMINAGLDILEANDQRSSIFHNYSMMRRELKKINDIMIDFINLTQNPGWEKDIVYLADIFKDTLENMQHYFPDIIVELSCPDNDIAVFAHESSIKMLFGNIVKNAMEAMDFSGKIEIEILRRENKAIILIADNGIGLSCEAQKNISKKYFTTKPEGSGLGLSICRKIAEDHDGSFSLKPRPESGCIAEVILPGIFD